MPNPRTNVIKRGRLTPRSKVILAVLAVVVVIAVLELTNTTHLFHKRKAVSGTIPSTTAKSSSPTKSGQSTATPSQTGSTSTTNTGPESPKNQIGSQQSSSGNVVTPFGTFVSNHHPNLGGSPDPSEEQSVCQTSPGASCYIKFVNGGVVKTLATQTTDQNGIVIWNWDVKKAGFTEGSWQITAVASSSGSTQSTTDQQALEIGP